MPIFLTVAEVAEELQISVHQVRVLIRNHSLPAARQSGQYLVERGMLERWLESQYAQTREWVEANQRPNFHGDWKDFPVNTRR